MRPLLAQRVSDRAADAAIALGLVDTREEGRQLLATMAGQSAIVTSPIGNRRYGVFFFRVRDGAVYDLTLEPGVQSWCEACYGTEVILVPDGSIRCPECVEI